MCVSILLLAGLQQALKSKSLFLLIISRGGQLVRANHTQTGKQGGGLYEEEESSWCVAWTGRKDSMRGEERKEEGT